MVGNLLATPRPLDCSTSSRRSPWPPSSSNALSAVALQHKHGGGDHVTGAHNSICNEIPLAVPYWTMERERKTGVILFFEASSNGRTLFFMDYTAERDLRLWDHKIGRDNALGFQGRTASIFTDLHQMAISSGLTDVKVTFGYIFGLEASFSLITTGKDDMLRRMVWGPTSPAMNSSLGECAAFGMMSSTDAAAGATLFCICLTASQPMSLMDWGAPGTRRLNASLDYCGKSSAVAWDVQRQSAALRKETSLQIKRRWCLANLSCLAFAAVQWGEDGGRCITWTPTSDKPREVLTVPWMFLQPSFPHSLWVLIVAATILIVIARAFSFRLKNWVRKWRPGTPCPKCSSVNTGADLPHDNIVKVPSMNLSTVVKATGGFSKKNIIGEGGFAIVYKGKVSKNYVLARDVHKRKIAVKRLKQSALSLKGSDDFEREVELMSKLDNGSLVRLVAYCVEDDERILVYEYMQNKSLDGYIFGTRKLRASLHWAKRLEIIHGIAQGVSYLHEGSGQNVIHRDLKPSNVLLDHKWTPKIADFGTTKLLVDDDTGTQTIVFSPGYAAPEYIRGDITLKCDVYSFGVVLLEIISGRRNNTSPSLLSHAWKLWDQHTITDLFDPLMTPPRSQSELCSRLRRCIQIGLLCVQESPGDRPSMPQVLAMLTSSSHSEPRKPKAPAVFATTTEQ